MFRKSSETKAPATFRMHSEARPSKGASVLGSTLTFTGGELSFNEDLVIEGTVEGRIAHQSHHLTIGKQGRVKADIKARLITVHGTVEGDLHGDEGVEIAATAHVIGNVVAPRISIENGASFQGSVMTTDASPVEARGASAETPPVGDLELGSFAVR